VTLPALLSWERVQERLQVIFPEGTAHRGYVTRDLAASTVFVALYIGAIEGSGVFLAPKHVYRMSDEQANMTHAAARADYSIAVMKPGGRAPGQQWYADTSREPIRDETLREGLVPLGAAIEKADVTTTSSKPRYALQTGFAALFEPALTGQALSDAIASWQAKALTKGALARIAIVRRGGAAGGEHVTVTFPNGQTLRMKPGPSSEITKAVVEVFAPRFLKEPAVLFVSESGNKILAHHDETARAIGLTIKADKNLPDTILVDLGPEHPLLVFVEAVATDGPINTRRKQALEELAKDAGFPVEHIAYVTAYLDRSGAPFKKTVDALAWGSYAWFVSEPEGLVRLSIEKTTLV
jgi:BsuBI/PstI restriction endonuclease domain/BsuBI/PstI restriction endonuclease HTH domain